MKKTNFVSSKNSGFESRFKSLNNEEMINLRGGAKPVPPLPPTGGDDYPIVLNTTTTTTTVIKTQPLPVL